MQLTPVAATGISNIKNNFVVETFPNPVTDMFSIRFNSDRTQNVEVQLFSLDGKLIKNLINKKVAAGIFTESFSNEDMSRGLYLLRINLEGNVQTQRLLVN
jgi:hypothetical protein